MLRPCSVRKRGREASIVDESQEEHSVPQLPPVPLTPNFKGKAIFILDNATVKRSFVRKKWKILNSEEDADFLRRQKKNLDDYRPDILYEALRAIQDSPIYKLGMVGAIYVKIDNGALFEVKPHVRLPRTLKRFCGIMLELLEKSCVRSKGTHETLLRVIEEPVTRYLPANSRIIGDACGLSYHSKKVVDTVDYVSAASDDLNLVFLVGVMVRGEVRRQCIDDFISVSNYPLGAKYCLRLICEALREKWKIF